MIVCGQKCPVVNFRCAGNPENKRKPQNGKLAQLLFLHLDIIVHMGKKAIQYSKTTRDELWQAIPMMVLQINMEGSVL
jgi:hypothetical protein